MRENGVLASDVDLKELAAQTKNFTGAEIEGLVRAAQSTAMNRFIKVWSHSWGVRWSHWVSMHYHFCQGMSKRVPEKYFQWYLLQGEIWRFVLLDALTCQIYAEINISNDLKFDTSHHPFIGINRLLYYDFHCRWQITLRLTQTLHRGLWSDVRTSTKQLNKTSSL